MAAVGIRAPMAAIEPERANECPSCGEAVVEKRVTCPSCGYQYEEGDYTMSPEELGDKTPDEFQTEVSEEELEKQGLQDESSSLTSASEEPTDSEKRDT